MISSRPSQYIKGWVEFYKLRFRVTPDVLIPRPETELLVDEVLNFVNSLFVVRKSLNSNEKRTTKNDITILDLGTGAGNIAISIAKNINPAGSTHSTREVKLIATDISEKALKVAKQNAKLHGFEDKITFVKSDLLSDLDCNLSPETCNLIIVTNLPYIPSARIPYLDSSVKDFEPHVALDGGKDGFELYRKLFHQIQERNWKPKLIIGEIDYTHGELAINEAQKYFPEAETEVRKDLTHLQRILTIKHLTD